MVDSFSKYAIFKVIPDKSAVTVANCFFENWISIFGSPLSIVTDRGTDFNTETMQEICNYLQIDKKVIATKHPESNAQAEILNKKLAKYLLSMTEKSNLDWPKLVPAFQYAYNLSVHKALKNSPYSVLFGMDANTPLNNKGFVSQPIYGEKYQHNLGNRLKTARQLAKTNNMNFREDYVKRFNTKVDPHDFRDGQLVYLHRPEMVKINPKITSPWFGPFVILSLIGQSNCLIQDIANRSKFVNSNRLRAYNNSISDWQKFQVTLKDNTKKETEKMQSETEKNECNSDVPRFAEFSKDNEVVILNPEVEPKPRLFKVEPTEILDSVPEEDPIQNYEETSTPNPIPGPSSGSTKSGKSTFAKTLHQLVSPIKPTKRVTRTDTFKTGEPLVKGLEKVKKKRQNK